MAKKTPGKKAEKTGLPKKTAMPVSKKGLVASDNSGSASKAVLASTAKVVLASENKAISSKPGSKPPTNGKFQKVVAEVLPNEDLETLEEELLAPKSAEKSVAISDPVSIYLQELRKYPLLSREQETALAIRYFETKDPAAAQALVTANLRFVVKVAADYSKFGARMIDLIQEGNMGLMHAVRDFNPHKGVRLITYAVWWIRGYIQEYLLKQYSMVKIATTLNQKKLFYRLQKEKDALDKMGIAPDMALIGTRMGIPTEEVEQMAQRLSGRDVSLNAPLDDSGVSQMMDVQRSGGASIDEQLGLNEELSVLKEKLEELRPELSDREKIILEERLLADEPLTLQEIGEKYGITREAVRQMEARLMKKIKDRVREEL